MYFRSVVVIHTSSLALPPMKGKGRGKRIQSEPDSVVTSAHDVVREAEPETKDSGEESVEQTAFNKKKVPEQQ